MTSRAGQLATVAALVLGVGLLPGCSESAEQRRAAYCDLVEQRSPELTVIADEGGAGGFVTALPILEKLAQRAPGDLNDEWQTLLNALRGLDEALTEAGLDPDDVDEKLPEDLPEADRRRVSGAASVLASDAVTAAARGIEQHALDICGVSLL